ncbi:MULTISPECIES: hypothetical protein [unclassified Variovorax]|uniref:hypothetical protein n=1 Tax=unclassified Variovorax TaxID=663243 RepID=UPI001315DFC3|nr:MULTISPECIES: hypothetical protein [unclassified Variovorax]VTU43107.1 hypothetical protein SRS16P1_00439 [Variovorax sp. SRS16]VTU43137.1 hypothetical protein E5P1_00436 [Variovorax sp. PBL-E5]VTU43443.1 hypothetical protein H6P1_00467 [Variovorax sp. PBL-H6]
MTTDNQQVTQVVQAIKRALDVDHGIKVPHAALRASYLKAQGKHPHAFAKSQKSEASQQAPAAPVTTKWATRTLYLVEDDIGCLERLALDEAGEYQLPNSFDFAPSAELVSQKARIPRIQKYGIPVYLQEPEVFYRNRFLLSQAKAYSAETVDTRDDSGDTCELGVRMPDVEWHRLVLAVIDDNPGLWDTIAEWVGQHYGAKMQAMSRAHQADWCMRFIQQGVESETTAAEGKATSAWVTLSWVYPDEDGDSVEAAVNLSTGLVKAIGEVPADVGSATVRVRIESELLDSEWLEVRQVKANDVTAWQVLDDDLEELRGNLG